ncbi:MAG TPA: tetraacyldisaccharide 4'-kinase [Pyrinomonadaceae bacterium]
MKPLILPPLGTLYGIITRTHARLYERGTFHAATLERPVISVGNITVGGTGKTPMVAWVAQTLASAGKKVCILTRGYKRENPKQRVLVSDGKTVFSKPAEAGDEPYLLASILKGQAAVISDANRFAAGQDAIKHLRTDCFVLDDGFQHFRLARSLNIVMIDATDPWGGGRMVPVGRLREPLTGLKRADCFVLTRCEQVDSIETLRSDLAKLSGDRPIFISRMHTTGVKPLDETIHGPLETMSIAAFCAVGNPTSFFEQLRRTSYDVRMEKSFPDHHVYTQTDIDYLNLAAQNSKAEALITTAKDAVKLPGLKFFLPCYFVEIEIEIENAAELQRLILQATL